jgi:hypothetical protein
MAQQADRDEGKRLNLGRQVGSASSQTRRIPGEADAEKAWSKSAADGAGVPTFAGVLASGDIASPLGSKRSGHPSLSSGCAHGPIRT